jgi:hypothetical protein
MQVLCISRRIQSPIIETVVLSTTPNWILRSGMEDRLKLSIKVSSDSAASSLIIVILRQLASLVAGGKVKEKLPPE